MAIAIWQNTVIAESDQCEVVEGNQYFPPDSVKREYFQPSETHTTCGWKGVASHYNLVVNGEVSKDAAWYYPEPKEKVRSIKDYVAFYKRNGVEIKV